MVYAEINVSAQTSGKHPTSPKTHRTYCGRAKKRGPAELIVWMHGLEHRIEAYRQNNSYTYPKDMMGAKLISVMNEETTKELRHLVRDGFDYNEVKTAIQGFVCIYIYNGREQ